MSILSSKRPDGRKALRMSVMPHLKMEHVGNYRESRWHVSMSLEYYALPSWMMALGAQYLARHDRSSLVEIPAAQSEGLSFASHEGLYSLELTVNSLFILR
jgi:hypothetical protein